MDYFGKPISYKNVSSSQYIFIPSSQKHTSHKIQNLLDKISSYSANDSSCTCS